MKVKECMCNQVYAAKPETTIYDIAKMMQTNQVGCIPICDNNNNMVGIVTDRDIVLRGVVCNKDIKTTPISEIMTTKVCYCAPNDDINQAEHKMSEYQIRRIPVVENNQIIGILTLGDLVTEGTRNQDVNTTMSNICNNEGQVKNGC